MFDDSLHKPQDLALNAGDDAPAPDDPSAGPDQTPAQAPSLARFAVCRWTQRGPDKDATHCGHPEVLPFAGANGFSPESWCGDCGFFKVKRVARKSYDRP